MINQIKGKLVWIKMVKTRAKKLIMRLFYRRHSEKSSKSNLLNLLKNSNILMTKKWNRMINQTVGWISSRVRTSSFDHWKAYALAHRMVKTRDPNSSRNPSHRLIYHSIRFFNCQNIKIF